MNYQDVKYKLANIANKFTYETGNSPFSGNNFMTNEIIKRGKFPNDIWFEISLGKHISGKGYMYGVSLKGNHNPLTLKRIQGCCFTFEEVEEKMRKAHKIRR